MLLKDGHGIKSVVKSRFVKLDHLLRDLFRVHPSFSFHQTCPLFHFPLWETCVDTGMSMVCRMQVQANPMQAI
jgi:hypothetical protein